MVNLLRKVNMPAAWLKGLLCSNDNEDENENHAAELLCSNDNDNDDDNFCSQRYQCETRSKPVLLSKTSRRPTRAE